MFIATVPRPIWKTWASSVGTGVMMQLSAYDRGTSWWMAEGGEGEGGRPESNHAEPSSKEEDPRD